MAIATGAGAYSRNSLGIVIAFGMLISTVLGRFVIPVYYVLGERIGDAGRRRRSSAPEPSPPATGTHHLPSTGRVVEPALERGIGDGCVPV